MQVRRVFVSAGEASGDALAASVLAETSRLCCAAGLELQVSGIGGPALMRSGLLRASVVDMSELSVMGLGEVLPRLPRLFQALRAAEAAATAFDPHAVLTVDSKGFNFRLLRRLASADARVSAAARLHVVAPSVWALKRHPWDSRETFALPFVDELFALLPFEPPYFPGCPTTFVGHPAQALEGAVPTLAPADADRERESAPEESTIGLFPGSRAQEWRFAAPLFESLVPRFPPSQRWTVSRVAATGASTAMARLLSLPNVRLAPAEGADGLGGPEGPEGLDPEGPGGLGCPGRPGSLSPGGGPGSPGGLSPGGLGSGDANRPRLPGAHPASQGLVAAVSVSGTMVTELNFAGVPVVVVYDAGILTRVAARALAKVRHVSLCNILAGDAVVPEHLFEDCEPAGVAASLAKLLRNPAPQKEALARVLPRLKAAHPPAQMIAAALFKRLLL